MRRIQEERRSGVIITIETLYRPCYQFFMSLAKLRSKLIRVNTKTYSYVLQLYCSSLEEKHDTATWIQCKSLQVINSSSHTPFSKNRNIQFSPEGSRNLASSHQDYGNSQMNLSTRQKQTLRHREQTCDCWGGGWGEVWIGSLGLADANYFVQNG